VKISAPRSSLPIAHYQLAMAQKKPFVLRLNPDMQKALEKWAVDEFRSLNGQIEYLLYQELKKNGRLPKSLPEQNSHDIQDGEEPTATK
jgi:hypothetical protein